MIGQLEIGDILEVDKIRLECREQKDGTCYGCYWFEEEDQSCIHRHRCGICSSSLRTDNKAVIFVKVGEVQNA